jgi:hypothetical protein
MGLGAHFLRCHSRCRESFSVHWTLRMGGKRHLHPLFIEWHGGMATYNLVLLLWPESVRGRTKLMTIEDPMEGLLGLLPA